MEKMTATGDALFPKVPGNIEAAQEKQKKQFLKEKEASIAHFRMVMQCCSMPQYASKEKKKGHKMEDQWTGLYTIEKIDLQKRTKRKKGKLGRIVHMKDLKVYRVQSTA